MISCPNCNETMNIRCERCGFRCKCGWKADDRDELRTHIKYENLKEKKIGIQHLLDLYLIL